MDQNIHVWMYKMCKKTLIEIQYRVWSREEVCARYRGWRESITEWRPSGGRDGYHARTMMRMVMTKTMIMMRVRMVMTCIWYIWSQLDLIWSIHIRTIGKSNIEMCILTWVFDSASWIIKSVFLFWSIYGICIGKELEFVFGIFTEDYRLKCHVKVFVFVFWVFAVEYWFVRWPEWWQITRCLLTAAGIYQLLPP